MKSALLAHYPSTKFINRKVHTAYNCTLTALQKMIEDCDLWLGDSWDSETINDLKQYDLVFINTCTNIWELAEKLVNENLKVVVIQEGLLFDEYYYNKFSDFNKNKFNNLIKKCFKYGCLVETDKNFYNSIAEQENHTIYIPFAAEEPEFYKVSEVKKEDIIVSYLLHKRNAEKNASILEYFQNHGYPLHITGKGYSNNNLSIKPFLNDYYEHNKLLCNSKVAIYMDDAHVVGRWNYACAGMKTINFGVLGTDSQIKLFPETTYSLNTDYIELRKHIDLIHNNEDYRIELAEKAYERLYKYYSMESCKQIMREQLNEKF